MSLFLLKKYLETLGVELVEKRLSQIDGSWGNKLKFSLLHTWNTPGRCGEEFSNIFTVAIE